MHMKLHKWAKAVISLVVSFYLFTAFVPMMHYHEDGLNKNNCFICYYNLNYQLQDLPSQWSVHEVISIQIYYVDESATYSPKVVFLFDPSRAPPRFSFVWFHINHYISDFYYKIRALAVWYRLLLRDTYHGYLQAGMSLSSDFSEGEQVYEKISQLVEPDRPLCIFNSSSACRICTGRRQ